MTENGTVPGKCKLTVPRYSNASNASILETRKLWVSRLESRTSSFKSRTLSFKTRDKERLLFYLSSAPLLVLQHVTFLKWRDCTRYRYLTFQFKRFQYLHTCIIRANQKWCLYIPDRWNRNRSDFGYFNMCYINCYGSLLLFCVREINHFLEIPIRESWKILWVSRNSILDTRNSKLDSRFAKTLRIEDRVSSRDCQLAFAWYCK